MSQVALSATIHIVAANDMVARLEHTDEGTHGGDPRGEHLAVLGVFKISEASIELIACGVATAGIVKSVVELSDFLLVESGG